MTEYIVSLVLDKIATHLIDEAVALSKVSTQVEWIEDELRRIQCFLKDADAKQDGDERIRNWIADIRDVAYDSDDVIDTYILKMAQQRKFLCFDCHPFMLGRFIARHKINRQINKVKTKIQHINYSRGTYGIENLGRGGEVTGLAVGRLREKRRSSPHACEEDTVGLVEDINMLEARVIHGESRRSVISIIGMAGVEYRVKEILQYLGKTILGLGKADFDTMSNEDLKELLSKFLEERRYIIVLDDIWKIEVWDDLKAAFPDAENGSRIVLTTRFKDVALHADPRSPPHELCLLSDEDSWKLLSKKVCLEWNSTRTLPPWSEELGRQIVKKCGGLPLAIVVLGGLLSRKEASYSEWLKVLQSVHWQLTQDPTLCADILALSYHDLPYYLTPCFLYLGLFPEDFEISARRLILLWVAEGFVQPRGQEPLEDVAEDYLEELIGRSMIQVAARKSNGRIKTCSIHDLLREFAISKAKEDRFLEVIHQDVKVKSFTRGRHLSVHGRVPPALKNTSKVRSILCFDLNEPVFREMKKFKLLRVLDLEGIHIARLDSAIGKLVHLRYLGLRGTWLKTLPSSVCYLVKLQTLDLRSTLVSPIPAVVIKLQQLRHLFVNEFREIVPSPPPSRTFLANLQTLHGLSINGTESVENVLNKLTNLRELGLCGELELQEKALAMWILNLKGLHCLKLHAAGNATGFPAAIPNLDFSSHTYLHKLRLVGLMNKTQKFPPNLTELSLQNSFLTEDPMEKLEKLPNLRVLKLKQSSYVGKEMICSSGGFPQLQILKLSFLSSVEMWRIAEKAMCSLRELEIVQCKRLKIVPRGLWPVSSLCILRLGYMPFDIEMKVQERQGENWYRIEHTLPF
ncbi:probable disease resistance RPP8-like protein 2 [Juglans microcarpa x Juglans regia]|uniref:probable disease resistance RPP8-like protein 2 n=1 Tax=Juglans microcarpa x Juglans regia TaxID=2249226 RepID=UPI001B7ECD2F|nr:probable disease resistance RPP8-like protein 2 [Juglans microcarpa x Juglans regia]